MHEWSECDTGCSYVGLNVLPDKRWGLDQFTWEGTYDESTGKHHGIHVHTDTNNMRGKLGAIIPLGSFSGFFQHTYFHMVSP